MVFPNSRYYSIWLEKELEGNMLKITQDAIVVFAKVSFTDIIAAFVFYMWCWLWAGLAERRDVFVVRSVGVWSHGVKVVSHVWLGLRARTHLSKSCPWSLVTWVLFEEPTSTTRWGYFSYQRKDSCLTGSISLIRGKTLLFSMTRDDENVVVSVIICQHGSFTPRSEMSISGTWLARCTCTARGHLGFVLKMSLCFLAGTTCSNQEVNLPNLSWESQQHNLW